MAGVRITDLPLVTEENFTAEDKFLIVDDGKAKLLNKQTFEDWVVGNIKGEAFTYDDFTAAQLAALKGEQGDPVPITTSLGQSQTEAVSQKLLTDEINNMNDVLGDIGAALSSINGV